MNLGKVVSINKVFNVKLGNIQSLNGTNGSSLGFTQMLNAICGYPEMDGYCIKTDQHEFNILIDNGQSCCENWGYFSSEDNFENFIEKELIEVNLTDVALNNQRVEDSGYYDDCGGIQFVNFVFGDNSVLQFAVYNAHNGYYGHGIIIAKDQEILLEDTL